MRLPAVSRANARFARCDFSKRRPKPAGKVPEEIDHVYGVAPPFAVSVCENAVPAMAEKEAPEVIVNAPMEMFNCCWTVSPVESANVTVKRLGPGELGVPEMTPVEALSCKPAGKTPAVIDQV